jgi:hypothetical protein
MSKEDVLLIVVLGLFIFLIGMIAGKFAQRDIMLDAYCQSIEYDGFTSIDNKVYCYRSDELLLVNWME